MIVVLVTVANMYYLMAKKRLMQFIKNLCLSVKLILANGKYRGKLAGNIRNAFGFLLQVIVSGYKKQGFRPIKVDEL